MLFWLFFLSYISYSCLIISWFTYCFEFVYNQWPNSLSRWSFPITFCCIMYLLLETQISSIEIWVYRRTWILLAYRCRVYRWKAHLLLCWFRQRLQFKQGSGKEMLGTGLLWARSTALGRKTEEKIKLVTILILPSMPRKELTFHICNYIALVIIQEY